MTKTKLLIISILELQGKLSQGMVVISNIFLNLNLMRSMDLHQGKIKKATSEKSWRTNNNSDEEINEIRISQQVGSSNLKLCSGTLTW